MKDLQLTIHELPEGLHTDLKKEALDKKVTLREYIISILKGRRKPMGK